MPIENAPKTSTNIEGDRGVKNTEQKDRYFYPILDDLRSFCRYLRVKQEKYQFIGQKRLKTLAVACCFGAYTSSPKREA